MTINSRCLKLGTKCGQKAARHNWNYHYNCTQNKNCNSSTLGENKNSGQVTPTNKNKNQTPCAIINTGNKPTKVKILISFPAIKKLYGKGWIVRAAAEKRQWSTQHQLSALIRCLTRAIKPRGGTGHMPATALPCRIADAQGKLPVKLRHAVPRLTTLFTAGLPKRKTPLLRRLPSNTPVVHKWNKPS